MTRRYLLPQGVHVCFTSDGTIFLDVRRDRYIGLDREKTRSLLTLMSDGMTENGDGEKVVGELIEQHLLTTGTGEGRPFSPSSIPIAKDALLDSALDDEPRIRLGHVIRFTQSCLLTWFALRWRSLEYAIRRRRAKEAKLGRDADVVYVQELVSVFLRLRPIFYVARDHCLFDSFALAEFLGRYEVHSTCVFGVTTLPFAAHCWVQMGAFLVDGTPSRIARFSPILAV